MVDQMEFLYQGIENARNQYQQQQQQARQQPQQQQPPFNEEVTSFPSPNASDLSHGSAFHPMQLQFQHRASFLNQHFFPFPQPHANFANINMTCQQQTTSPDLSAQLLLQQQLQQQQQQLQLSPQHLTPPLQMSPPLHHQLSQLPQLQHQPQRHHHHDHQPEQQQQQQPQLLHQTTVAQPEPSAHGAKTTGDNHGKRDKKKKTKRVRTTFTPEQLSRLEAEFADQGYLVGEYRNYLAKVLHLSECQVKVWFQNRRIKKRKQEKQAMKAEQ